MVTGCHIDSGLEISFQVLGIYERCGENLSVVGLGSRGTRSGSCEHHRGGLVVRTEIKSNRFYCLAVFG